MISPISLLFHHFQLLSQSFSTLQIKIYFKSKVCFDWFRTCLLLGRSI
nr:MAG TPA: hypothetical protein [Caudoviricetes sp.]